MQSKAHVCSASPEKTPDHASTALHPGMLQVIIAAILHKPNGSSPRPSVGVPPQFEYRPDRSLPLGIRDISPLAVCAGQVVGARVPHTRVAHGLCRRAYRYWKVSMKSRFGRYCCKIISTRLPAFKGRIHTVALEPSGVVCALSLTLSGCRKAQ